jgi:hypothetical protein
MRDRTEKIGTDTIIVARDLSYRVKDFVCRGLETYGDGAFFSNPHLRLRFIHLTENVSPLKFTYYQGKRIWGI